MKKFLVGLLGVVIMLSSVGCSTVITGIDRSKTQIYVSYYTGGYGSTWLEQARVDFNAQNKKYEVIVVPDKLSQTQIDVDLASSNPNAQAYFSISSDFRTAINNGNVADLSSILDVKAEGETLSIGDKIRDKELWTKIGSKDGEGLYMLPNTEAITGLVYDYQLFIDQGWSIKAKNDEATKAKLTEQGISFKVVGNALQYDDNSFILSAGKDAKFNTYDDGQPITESEWKTMLTKITNDSAYPFIWTGKFPHYTDPIIEAMLAQYAGMDAYNLFYSYDGKYLDKNGAEVVVTPKTWDKVYEMPAMEKSIQFMKDNLASKTYQHPKAVSSEQSHTDAQNVFLLGYKDESLKTTAAMLVEGAWWEYEASPTMKALVNEEGDIGRGYGEREYRYMLLPQLDGSRGANGDGTGSVLATSDSSAVVVSSKQSPEMLEKTKEFIAFSLKDKYLKMFTATTGNMRPYNYDMTDAELAMLTPFARNLKSIYQDPKNVTIVRSKLLNQTSPLNYASTKQGKFFTTNSDGSASYSVPITGLDRQSAKDYFDGVVRYNSINREKFYNDVKGYYEK